MQIREVTTYSKSLFLPLQELMMVLDPTLPLKEEVLKELIHCADSHLYVLEAEGRIIGCYTLGVFTSPTGRKASIEDVVVHPDFQGQHLGRKLLDDALERLKGMAPIHVQLTSRPMRVAANKLYQRVGFRQKETNVYVMDFTE